MAAAVPPSLIRLGINVLVTLTIVKTFPQYLPDHALLYVFVRLLALQLTLLAIWNLAIYPFFVSPLRHLPGPGIKVSVGRRLERMHCSSIITDSYHHHHRAHSLLLAMASPCLRSLLGPLT